MARGVRTRADLRLHIVVVWLACADASSRRTAGNAVVVLTGLVVVSVLMATDVGGGVFKIVGPVPEGSASSFSQHHAARLPAACSWQPCLYLVLSSTPLLCHASFSSPCSLSSWQPCRQRSGWHTSHVVVFSSFFAVRPFLSPSFLVSYSAARSNKTMQPQLFFLPCKCLSSFYLTCQSRPDVLFLDLMPF